MASKNQPPASTRARPRHHERDAHIANGKARAGSQVNVGVLPSEKDRQAQLRAGRQVADATTALVEEEDGWDDRFLPAGMRDDASTAVTEPERDIWDRRLMPERLRTLLAEGEFPKEVPDEPFTIVTREDIDRMKDGAPPADYPSTGEDTLIEFEPAFPDGGGPPPPTPGGFDGEDFSHLPPPPAPDMVPSKDRLNRALHTAAYSFMGAFTAATAVTYGTMAAGQAGNSSVTVAAMMAGAAVPHATRIVRDSLGGARLGKEWKAFQSQTGWKPRQCRRWERAGFTPQQAAAWEHEFRTRPGMDVEKYPPGGTKATVKMAKEFRDIGGDGTARVTPEQASEFIHAWITPENIKEWNEKYIRDNASHDERDELRAFMLAAHRQLSMQTGHWGYKSVDVAMKNMCNALGIPSLRRWDKSDDSLLERYNRDMGTTTAALADTF